jgi:prepilin-type processing-associated H-X9-DG protein
MDSPLSPDMLDKMNAYWRAANYLSVGQIYLYDNPLLREPLTLAHIKPRLLGHWADFFSSATRHNDGTNVGFVDGHSKWLQATKMTPQMWTPAMD